MPNFASTKEKKSSLFDVRNKSLLKIIPDNEAEKQPSLQSQKFRSWQRGIKISKISFLITKRKNSDLCNVESDKWSLKC